MKFFTNNNTTYNYSYYATRPKWLVEVLLKEPFSQKESKGNSLYLKKSFPIHKIAFAYPEGVRDHQKFLCSTASFPQQKAHRVKAKRQGSKVKEPFLTQSPLKTINPPVFGLRTQTKDQTMAPQQLKSKAPIIKASFKIIKASSKKACQHLFQTRELLCWTSDLSFFNLRGYFSNILKVLQICRFAVRNNQKILFIKGSRSSYSQGKLLNPWLVQYERNTVPVTLNNLFNKTYLTPTRPFKFPEILCFNFKKNRGKKHDKKYSLKMTNIVKQPLPEQTAPRGKHSPQSFVKETILNREKDPVEDVSSKPEEKNPSGNKKNCRPYSNYRRYYLLSGLLNSCLNKIPGKSSGYKASYFKNLFVFAPYFKHQETSFPAPLVLSLPEAQDQGISERLQSKGSKLWRPKMQDSSYLKNQNYLLYEQRVKNSNQYQFSPKKATTRTDHLTTLWIKEAQIMSQQTAAGLTIPLAGFLANSKIAFNTIYNLSNSDFYNSASSNLKSNSLFNKGVEKIETARLEKVDFQNSNSLFSLTSVKKRPQSIEFRPNRTTFTLPLYKSLMRDKSKVKGKEQEKKSLAFTKVQVKSKCGLKEGIVKSFKHNEQKQASRGLEIESYPGVSGLSLLNTLESSTELTIPKEVKKDLSGTKKSNIDIVLTPSELPFKPSRRVKSFTKGGGRESDQKGWWTDYSDSYNYLPLTPNTRGKFFFKDSESISRNEKTKKPKLLEYCFFGDLFTWQPKSQKSSSMFNSNTPFKNRDNIIPYLKKQVILEKRKPIVLKKKKPPFFTPPKTQLQGLKKLALKLKRPLRQNDLKDPKKKQAYYLAKGSFLNKKQSLSRLAKFIASSLDYCNVAKGGLRVRNSLAYIDLPSFPTVEKKTKIALNSDLDQYSHNPVYKYTVASPFTQGDQKNKKSSRKKQGLRSLLFYKYYKTIVGLNHFNQYKMFAKTPFVNNQLADIIFFINPEKNQNLVNQANRLKIPTVGIVSGNTANSQGGHLGNNDFRLKESVYYPILGNSTSGFFTRAIVHLIVKFLRVEKSKDQPNKITARIM